LGGREFSELLPSNSFLDGEQWLTEGLRVIDDERDFKHLSLRVTGSVSQGEISQQIDKKVRATPHRIGSGSATDRELSKSQCLKLLNRFRR